MALKYFKKSYLLMALLSVILLLSCGDNKDECETFKLTGKWKTSSSSTEIFVNGVTYAEFLVQNFDISVENAELEAAAYTPDLDWLVNFKDDNSYELTDGEDQIEGTWTIDKDGTEIVLDEDTNNEMVMEIISLYKDALLVTFTESGIINDMNEDGEFETVEIITNVAFTR